ncbi:MAG: hypothetical protein H3C47_07850 [Candidatus Cloacimonetes bacterium]|nr:hypothetical protein [Candidatus Cloacimonadota bacterium]
MVIKTGSVADYRPILNLAPVSPIPEAEKITPVSPAEAINPVTDKQNDSEKLPSFLPQKQDPTRPPTFDSETSKKSDTEKKDGSGKELTPQEQEEINKLKARDAEVSAHENAHAAAAGPYARGGANYSYQTGPDGKRYRVGGHVNIDISEERDPRATIQKAQVIYRAALAPAEPSSQDRSVASAAKQMEARARQQLAEEEKSNSQSNVKKALNAYEKSTQFKAQFSSGFSLAA